MGIKPDTVEVSATLTATPKILYDILLVVLILIT